jgi:hypothetical protein
VAIHRSLFVSSLLFTACASEDPEAVATSENISIRLGGINEGAVRDGEASVDKKVDEESGNPYGEFLRVARSRLQGRDPSAILVRSATVQLRDDTSGVISFDQVFASMELFVSDDRTTVPIGTIAAPSGTSQAAAITATMDSLAPMYDSMLAPEKFRVGVRGPTVATPPTNFDLRLTVDITFEAIP